MNSRLIFTLVALISIFGVCLAQTTSEQQRQSEEILMKVRKIELYNQVLPVLMSSDQIKALLPILEKHRAEADKQELDEHRMLKQMEAEINKTLKDCQDKGVIPPPEILNKCLITFRAFSMRRKALIDDTVAELKKVMREKLNEGQVRAAANAFNPGIIAFEMKTDNLTDDQKLDYWVRLVLIDNYTYGILLDMSRKK